MSNCTLFNWCCCCDNNNNNYNNLAGEPQPAVKQQTLPKPPITTPTNQIQHQNELQPVTTAATMTDQFLVTPTAKRQEEKQAKVSEPVTIVRKQDTKKNLQNNAARKSNIMYPDAKLSTSLESVTSNEDGDDNKSQAGSYLS